MRCPTGTGRWSCWPRGVGCGSASSPSSVAATWTWTTGSFGSTAVSSGVDGDYLVGDPTSQAGRRTVTIPPHLVPTLVEHLDRHIGPEPGDLLFPAGHGGHMAPSTLYKVWYPAREAAGRPDLRFHDLRHTGATLAAATGATLADLMARMGHSTSAAALRYQHSAADRDKAIAEALSRFAADNVVSLTGRRASKRRAPATR